MSCIGLRFIDMIHCKFALAKIIAIFSGKEPVQCSTCILQRAICLLVYEVVAFFIRVQDIWDQSIYHENRTDGKQRVREICSLKISMVSYKTLTIYLLNAVQVL